VAIAHDTLQRIGRTRTNSFFAKRLQIGDMLAEEKSYGYFMRHPAIKV
jgi:hypothetical protein